MKRVITIATLGACLLAITPVLRAQNCIHLTQSLSGTYTASGSGWVDLSKFLAGIPGLPPLPTGFIPMSWVGTFTFDGTGGGSGWVSFNGGGNQMSAAIVDKTYTVKPDCTIEETFSLKINELTGNPVIGPFTRLAVPVFKEGCGGSPRGLELRLIWQGSAPGTAPGPVIDSAVAFRISLQS